MKVDPTRTGANPDEPLPPAQVILPEVASHPDATELLVNALMAEGLHILRDAAQLYRSWPYDPLERGHFVNHSVSVMKAGAKLADMAVKLKSGHTRSETRQHYTVEHVTRTALPKDGRGEGGSENPKNE